MDRPTADRESPMSLSRLGPRLAGAAPSTQEHPGALWVFYHRGLFSLKKILPAALKRPSFNSNAEQQRPLIPLFLSPPPSFFFIPPSFSPPPPLPSLGRLPFICRSNRTQAKRLSCSLQVQTEDGGTRPRCANSTQIKYPVSPLSCLLCAAAIIFRKGPAVGRRRRLGDGRLGGRRLGKGRRLLGRRCGGRRCVCGEGDGPWLRATSSQSTAASAAAQAASVGAALPPGSASEPEAAGTGGGGARSGGGAVGSGVNSNSN